MSPDVAAASRAQPIAGRPAVVVDRPVRPATVVGDADLRRPARPVTRAETDRIRRLLAVAGVGLALLTVRPGDRCGQPGGPVARPVLVPVAAVGPNDRPARGRWRGEVAGVVLRPAGWPAGPRRSAALRSWFAAAADRELVVVVVAGPGDFADVARLATAHPVVPVLLRVAGPADPAGGAGGDGARIEAAAVDAVGAVDNVLRVVSGTEPADRLTGLVARYGAARLCFGSGGPVASVGDRLARLRGLLAGLADEARAAVLGENLRLLVATRWPPAYTADPEGE